MKTHKKAHGLSIGSIIKIIGLTLAGCLAIIVIFLLVTPYPSYSDCFRTLQEVEIYAKNSTELIPMDNNNTLKPEFNNYYKKFTQTYSKTAYEKFVWLGSKIGLKKQPLWSISAFKTLLERATKAHVEKGFQGTVIAKIEGTENSKFVVFGNIQGALHSLTRDLDKLKELGIIDTNFKIIQPNHYIIFNGDVIDRSPYTLESLTVILKLIVTNPEHVVYIRGHHEEGNYWQEHTLKTELLIRASVVSKTSIPLEKEVNAFFATLPLALYISMPPNNSQDFVRISRFGFGEEPHLEESKYTQFLQKKSQEPLASFVIKDQSTEDAEAEEKIKIRVLIKAEKKRQEFQAMEGLRLLPPDKGITSWNVLSCPTVVYGTVLKFFNDAFVVITPGKTIEDWDITLFARDRRENQPFFTKSYNFVEGTKDGKPAKKEGEKGEKEKSIDKKESKKSHEKSEKKEKNEKKEKKPKKEPVKEETDKEITEEKPEKPEKIEKEKPEKEEKPKAEKVKEEKPTEENEEAVKKAAQEVIKETPDEAVKKPVSEKQVPEKTTPEKETVPQAQLQTTVLPPHKQPVQQPQQHQIPIMIITPPNVIVQQVTIPEQDAVQEQTHEPVQEQKMQPITSQNITIVPGPAQKSVIQQPVVQKQPDPRAPVTSPITTVPVTQQAAPQQNIPQILPEQPGQIAINKSVAFSAAPGVIYVQEDPQQNIAADTAQQFAQQLLNQSTDILLLQEPPIEQMPIDVETSPFYR